LKVVFRLEAVGEAAGAFWDLVLVVLAGAEGAEIDFLLTAMGVFLDS